MDKVQTYCNIQSSTTAIRLTIKILLRSVAVPLYEAQWSAQYLLTIIDGQVRLVRLQTDNFHLFLRQPTNK
jgi:hypothetical protein